MQSIEKNIFITRVAFFPTDHFKTVVFSVEIVLKIMKTTKHFQWHSYDLLNFFLSANDDVPLSQFILCIKMYKNIYKNRRVRTAQEKNIIYDFLIDIEWEDTHERGEEFFCSSDIKLRSYGKRKIVCCNDHPIIFIIR
jgi:hypothetical protein